MYPDLILLNGIIHTLAEPATVTALAAAGGRILALGDDATISALAGPQTRVLDLAGRCVVPGMIDAHLHLAWFGQTLSMVNLDGAASLAECLERVRAFIAAGRYGKNTWARGSGWNHNAWSQDARPSPVFPDRHALDSVAPDVPVLLRRKDGHSIWVNSPALRLAGVTAATPDPPYGQIDRDPATGEPTGILRESAMDLVEDIIPAPGPAELEQALLLAQREALAAGLTGVHTMEGPAVFAALQRLALAGTLKLRVCQSIQREHLDDAIGLGLRSGFGNERLRLGGVKLFADGSLGSATAAMLDDYEGMPGNRGIATLSKPELAELVKTAVAAGIAPVTHAIGDRANRDVLDVYADVYADVHEHMRAAGTGAGLRFRVEHVQALHPADIGRFARLGVVASMQPIHCTSDRDAADRLWGGRSRYAYAWRSLLASGAVLAFGSDCPVETISPLAGIHAAVTRQRQEEPQRQPWYPEERLTPLEALRAYTLGAAYASGEEALKGSLAAGKLADMVVLSQDILAAPPPEIPTTEVDITISGGEIVYERG
jgi:predicted amidohydrolase YtcJ